MITGVMDSGIGGITTLKRLMSLCGGDFVYVSDKLGPYGDKSETFIADRTMEACAALKAQGAEIIVLACNTATDTAISLMRRVCDDTFFIGTEPAVKPALRECKKVSVALTPACSKSRRFISLIEGNEDRVQIIAPPCLAAQIERAYMNKCALKKLAERLVSEVNGDGLVLGCTHYLYLKEYLALLRPNIKIYDGNDGVARQLLSIKGKESYSSVKFIKIG